MSVSWTSLLYVELLHRCLGLASCLPLFYHLLSLLGPQFSPEGLWSILDHIHTPELGASNDTGLAKTLLNRDLQRWYVNRLRIGMTISVSNIVDWYMACVTTGHIIVSRMMNND
jgi:hypothetical protein